MPRVSAGPLPMVRDLTAAAAARRKSSAVVRLVTTGVQWCPVVSSGVQWCPPVSTWETEMQGRIDFDATHVRGHLGRCGLARCTIELVMLLVKKGRKCECDGELVYRLRISKRKAAKEMGCSATAAVKASQRLEILGVLAVVRFGGPAEYVLSWTRLRQLEPPPDPVEAREVFSGGWTPVDTKAPVFREESFLESRVRASVSSRETGDPVSIGDHPRPWGVLTDAHLRMVHRDEAKFAAMLRRLYHESLRDKKITWLSVDGHTERKSFLAMAYHAATTELGDPPAGCKTQNRRVAIFTKRVKTGNWRRLRQASWDWANRVMGRQAAGEATAEVKAAAGLLKTVI